MRTGDFKGLLLMSDVWGRASRSLAALALVVLPVQVRAADLTASRALEAASEVLLGDPYGATLDEVKRNIKRQEKVGADDPDCEAPAWKFLVVVPASESNPNGINGYLCLSPKGGKLLRAGLPFLD
jgi:hypothetical protein